MSSRSIFSDISDTCGRRCLTIFRQALLETKKIKKHEETVNFLRLCVSDKMLPRSLWFRLPGRFNNDEKLKWQTGAKMLHREISRHMQELRQLEWKRDMRLECLQDLIPCNDIRSRVPLFTEECARRAEGREKSSFSLRLTRLKELHGKVTEATCDSKTVPSDSSSCNDGDLSVSNPASGRGVVNLSSYVLSPLESGVLGLGLNFAVTPRGMDVVDVVAALEVALNSVNPSLRNHIRFQSSRILKSSKPASCNLKPEERSALKALQTNDDIIVLAADKGNTTVVLDHNKYVSDLETLLSSGPYCEVKTDPGKRFRETFYSILSPVTSAGIAYLVVVIFFRYALLSSIYLTSMAAVRSTSLMSRCGRLLALCDSLFSPIGKNVSAHSDPLNQNSLFLSFEFCSS